MKHYAADYYAKPKTKIDDKPDMDFRWKLFIAFIAGNITGAVGSILLGCL